MTTAAADIQELTPQERLAEIVAEVTDNGRRVVRFFMQVTEGRLDHEGFMPNHRMDSAKELVKIGLTKFQDYIDAQPSPPKRRKTRRQSSDVNDISPEILQAREELAKYARELTQDGRTVIQMYSEVMDGSRNDEGFKPHHRIAAGRELLLRGFGPVSAWPEPVSESQPQADDTQLEQVAPGSQRENYPTLALTPTVSEYISEAVEAYEEESPLRQLLPQNILDIVDSDDPLDDCPCAIAEAEGRDIPCTENEECPYFGIEFPEFSEEDKKRIKEQALRGLRMRAELLGYASHSEEDP